MDHQSFIARTPTTRWSFMPTSCRRNQSQRRRSGRLHRRHCATSQPQAAAISRPSLLARRHGGVSRGRRPQAQRRGMALRARLAGDAEQADQLAALAFQICPDGQAAARAAVASGLAGFPDCDPRDRARFSRIPISACCCCRTSRRRSAWRLPTAASACTGCAAARSCRNPPERYARLHGKFDLCLLELSETDMEDGGELDRPDRAADEERRPHHSFRPQPPRRRQRRRVRPQRHLPGFALHPLRRGADRNPFRAVERGSAVGPQRHVQAAAD